MRDGLRDFATGLVYTWIEYIETHNDSQSQEADTEYRTILESNLTQLEDVVKYYDGSGTVKYLVAMTLPTLRANLAEDGVLDINQKITCMEYTLIAIFATLHPDGSLSNEPYEQTQFYVEFKRMHNRALFPSSFELIKPLLRIVLDMLST